MNFLLFSWKQIIIRMTNSDLTFLVTKGEYEAHTYQIYTGIFKMHIIITQQQTL